MPLSTPSIFCWVAIQPTNNLTQVSTIGIPELKTDWPFLWFENEYTVSTISAYSLAANAAIAAANER